MKNKDSKPKKLKRKRRTREELEEDERKKRKRTFCVYDFLVGLRFGVKTFGSSRIYAVWKYILINMSYSKNGILESDFYKQNFIKIKRLNEMVLGCEWLKGFGFEWLFFKYK